MASKFDSKQIRMRGRAHRERLVLEALPLLGPVRPNVEVLAIAVLVLCPLVEHGLAEGQPVLLLDVGRGENLDRARSVAIPEEGRHDHLRVAAYDAHLYGKTDRALVGVRARHVDRVPPRAAADVPVRAAALVLRDRDLPFKVVHALRPRGDGWRRMGG